MPYSGPLHVLKLVIMSTAFVLSLSQMLVVVVVVCDDEHTSFHFGLCGRKFVLCLIGECPCLCHSWQHAWVLHLYLQLASDR